MKIGFIGLGIMGKPMSKNLLKAGYEVVVYDHKPTSIQELVAAGGEASHSAAGAAQRCDIVIIMVQNSPQVKQAILAANGVIEGARPGTLVIDMSSIDPIASREIGAALAAKGINFLDAPVSGGEPKAREGTLSIMVGGREEDFERALPVLKCMGASVVRVGDVGAGNVTKVANQIIVALNIAAVSEALVLATKAGVDPELVYLAIRAGLAGSAVLDAKAPLMLARKFNPGFRINLHIKDLANAISTGHEVGVSLPLTSAIMEIMQALKVDGLGDADHGAIIRFYEKLAQVEATKANASTGA